MEEVCSRGRPKRRQRDRYSFQPVLAKCHALAFLWALRGDRRPGRSQERRKMGGEEVPRLTRTLHAAAYAQPACLSVAFVAVPLPACLSCLMFLPVLLSCHPFLDVLPTHLSPVQPNQLSEESSSVQCHVHVQSC